jgi:hypothetical protein
VSAIVEANTTVSWFARPDRTLSSRPDALEVAVEVSGTRATDAAAARELFSEATHTTLVFADGAVVRLTAAVAVGQLLFVRHERTQRELVTRVLRQRRSNASGAYVELEFTEAAPDFWAEDLVFAAAASAGEDAATATAIGQPSASWPAPAHPAVPGRPEDQGAESSDLSLREDDAAESYELLNDGGPETIATEVMGGEVNHAQAADAEAGGAGYELEDSHSADGHATASQPVEEEAAASSYTMPDETEVARLRGDLDVMRAQMSAVLDQTQATVSGRAADGTQEEAVETAKLSEDLAQMFAVIQPELSPAPAAGASHAPVAAKATFAPPIVANPAVTSDEFAKELERLNRARKQGISVEELEEEFSEAAASDEENEAAAHAGDALPEEADGETRANESKSKKAVAVMGLFGAAANGSRNTARMALMAAVLLVALLGGVAYWKGWIGGGGATAGSANSVTTPFAGGGVLRPVAKKSAADETGATAVDATTGAAADNAKVSRGAEADAQNDAAAAGEGANAQKAPHGGGALQAAARYLRGAVQGGEAVAAPAEESGEGYEPPKVVKAVNAVPPPEAVQNFVTGDVKFNALIDASGKVMTAEVLSGPESLRAAALEALKKYQYKAAVKNGQAVAGHVVVAVKFWYEP